LLPTSTKRRLNQKGTENPRKQSTEKSHAKAQRRKGAKVKTKTGIAAKDRKERKEKRTADEHGWTQILVLDSDHSSWAVKTNLAATVPLALVLIERKKQSCNLRIIRICVNLRSSAAKSFCSRQFVSIRGFFCVLCDLFCGYFCLLWLPFAPLREIFSAS
jgi:hypothetical protein